MGNVLTGDDGFGVRVAERLLADGNLPPGAKVVEVGIGGMHVVQELMGGYDGLIVVDAVDRGDPPGRVCVLAPFVPGVEELSHGDRAEILAETHHTVPARAMTMAKALGVLPPRVRIVGCQPADIDLGTELSDVVEAGVDVAIGKVRRIVGAWLREDVPATRENDDG